MPTSSETLVITGTSRGIGLHLARHFLEKGHPVVGISRSQTPWTHKRFTWIRGDLSRPEEVDALAEKLKDFPVKGLINNSGTLGPLGPFERNDFSQWVEAFQVNFFAAARLSQILIPSLKTHKGFLIFLSGGGSGFGRADFSAYGVSKTAIVRLAENLALELKPDVLVYCVAPGPNPTALLEESIRHGVKVPPEELVDFSDPVRLCDFLSRNSDDRYSGKFIHVKDDYVRWGERILSADAFTLRRIKPDTA